MAFQEDGTAVRTADQEDWLRDALRVVLSEGPGAERGQLNAEERIRIEL
jgi:hypothetical protein